MDGVTLNTWCWKVDNSKRRWCILIVDITCGLSFRIEFSSTLPLHRVLLRVIQLVHSILSLVSGGCHMADSVPRPRLRLPWRGQYHHNELDHPIQDWRKAQGFAQAAIYAAWQVLLEPQEEVRWSRRVGGKQYNMIPNDSKCCSNEVQCHLSGKRRRLTPQF